MIKYDDILHYKKQINNEHKITCFVYILLSKKFFYELVDELNVKIDYDKYNFTHKEQFTYDKMIFLVKDSLENYNVTFTVTIENVKKSSFNFAGFSIEILSGNERMIKRLLE